MRATALPNKPQKIYALNGKVRDASWIYYQLPIQLPFWTVSRWQGLNACITTERIFLTSYIQFLKINPQARKHLKEWPFS